MLSTSGIILFRHFNFLCTHTFLVLQATDPHRAPSCPPQSHQPRLSGMCMCMFVSVKITRWQLVPRKRMRLKLWCKLCNACVSVCVMAANNITFPLCMAVIVCCCQRADRQRNRMQRPVIIPIMHTDSEQGNGTVKKIGHGRKQPVTNCNLIKLVCVSE